MADTLLDSRRIVVADDHPVFRDGIRRIVQRLCPLATVHEAGTFDEVLALSAILITRSQEFKNVFNAAR